jgi:SAM-dependent methyltransferase
VTLGPGVACPDCRTPFAAEPPAGEDVGCDGCGARFGRRDGYLDLRPVALASEEYRDPATVDGFAARESAGSDRRFREYFAPLLRGLAVDRVACLGCGGGEDVAALVVAGLDAVGADLPHRTAGWAAAGRDPGRLVVADGRRLPWADGSFDAAVATGVLEHIGAVEDGVDLHDDYEAQRIAFLAESTRILRPGGVLVLAAPNGAFPVDLQHNVSRRPMTQRIATRTGLAVHSPRDPFLPRYDAVRRWADAVGTGLTTQVLPLSGYLGLSFGSSRFLRPFAPAIRVLFRLLDRAPDAVRESGLNPYLVVAVRRPVHAP